MKNVSVVIPTYNGKKLLEKHLPAVFLCMRKGDELIIIDDASSDGTADWLEKKYQNIKILSNKENLRFAATANRGVKLAKYNLVFLVNNDVTPHKDCLKYLIPHFEDKKVFAVGCLEIEKNELGGKNKLEFKRGLFVHFRATEFSSGETAWVSGGSGMFDRNKWLKLGGFNLDYYPAYWEDVDLSFRARKKSWKILFEAKAQVDHRHEITNKSVFGQEKIEVMSIKNSLVFLWKNASLTQKFLHLFWLPYHLTITNKKMHGNFLKGFLKYLSSLGH